MNLVDAYVTKIISKKPEFKYKKYWTEVEYNCMGTKGEKSLMFSTEKEALEVEVGYKFYT